METPIKAKKILKIKGMAKENIYMLMEVITMVIGLKIKCLGMEYYTILMVRYSMMDNGKKIYLMVVELYMEEVVIGISTKDSSKMDR